MFFRSAFFRVHPWLILLLVFRERAHVVHDVPALFLGHAFLSPAGMIPRDTFRDLPEDLAVSHRCHAFFVRQVGGFATQTSACLLHCLRQSRRDKKCSCPCLFQVELFAFLDRLGVAVVGFLVLSASSGSSQVFFEKSCCAPAAGGQK